MAREIVMLFVDESHLVWGDALGYVWGPMGERIEIPIRNERARQTYYGALDLMTSRAMVVPVEQANSDQTLAFLKGLRRRFQGRPMILVWDGASYHRSDAVKAYLQELNGDRPEAEWRIQMMQFASNAPEQNPMEDVWLAGKQAVRKRWDQVHTFANVKTYFTKFIDGMTFQFEKLNWYGRLQLI